MATPAAKALSDAGGGAAAAAAGAAAGAGAAPGAGGGEKHFWDDWVPAEQQELRDWVRNKNYKDPATLLSSAHTFERDAAALRASKGYPVDKVVDGKPVRDEQAWRAWNLANAVPESPDKYDIPTPELNPYPELKTVMAQEFHKIGMPPTMATAVTKAWNAAIEQIEAKSRAAEDQQSQLALAELEHAWGANYKERMGLAARGKAWLSDQAGGLSDIQLRTMEAVMGTPKFLAAMWKLGAGNGEAPFKGGDGGREFAGGSSEAQERLSQITTDRSSGKITDMEWRDKYEKEVLELGKVIAAGMAPGAGNA